ncbi:MAG: pilus assembly protein PilP [Desulforhopalus sp.]
MSHSDQKLSSLVPTARTIGRLSLICGFSFIGLFFTGLVSASINAAEQPPTQTVTEDSKFKYQLDGRPDPFVPFITAKAATAKVDMNEIVDVNHPLSGMQLFEPGQLTLVALMVNGAQDTAMVEDFTGKGYVLSEGTKIGKRGVVKDIAPNKVIIEETAVTRAGKKIITELVMTLKKEGEE